MTGLTCKAFCKPSLFSLAVNTSYVGFFAQRTVSDEVAAYGQVAYNDVITEVGGAYDAASGSFVCPVNGYYFFTVTVTSDVSVSLKQLLKSSLHVWK